MVLELLAKKPKGLYGFKMHFSNGSASEFTRNKKGTMAINLLLDASGLGFMEGNLDELKQEWYIGEKRLFEVGLPGRYNEPQEWMPIIFPGDSGKLQEEALAATEDERIQRVLFYMFCTGYRAIEFVAKMAVKLEKKHTLLPGGVHLEMVTQGEEDRNFDNVFIYDGTLYLESSEIEKIKEGLDTIQRSLDGIAFAFEKPVKWQYKYLIHGHTPGYSFPRPKDMTFLRNLLTAAQKENDITIDSAINWHKLGHLTDNKLNAFLCFHISIEGLAVKLAKGELDASKFFQLVKEKKEDKEKRMKEVFDKYYQAYYASDLQTLIEKSYFEGIKSITEDMRRAFSAVFGSGNPVIDEYFRGKESINTMRGDLAHGELSDWHYDEYMKVWSKLGRVQEISKAFITRVLLRIPPGEDRPRYSGRSVLSMSMDRPNSTLVATRPDVFPRKDWRIQPEWIE